MQPIRNTRRGYRTYFLLLLLGAAHICAAAQAEKDKSTIDTLLSHFSRLYSPKHSIISFHVAYVYTNETRENEVLDSLAGFFELSGGRSHSVLDKTESIINDSLSLTLFTEEKVMYLSKAGNRNMLQNPVGTLHTLLQAVPGLRFALTRSAASDTISMDFPPGMEYKSVRIVSARSTGLLQKVIYVVKTDQLADPMDKEAYDLSKYDTYAKVTASFSNYTREKADNSIFDNSRYFTREGNDIIAAPSFGEYKVYIGSAGL